MISQCHKKITCILLKLKHEDILKVLKSFDKDMLLCYLEILIDKEQEKLLECFSERTTRSLKDELEFIKIKNDNIDLDKVLNYVNVMYKLFAFDVAEYKEELITDDVCKDCLLDNIEQTFKNHPYIFISSKRLSIERDYDYRKDGATANFYMEALLKEDYYNSIFIKYKDMNQIQKEYLAFMLAQIEDKYSHIYQETRK